MKRRSIITEIKLPAGRILRRVDPAVIKRALRAAGKVCAAQAKDQANG